MRLAIISANLGAFDAPAKPPVTQVWVDATPHLFTSATMPPRPLALSSRLHAKIPKMFGWDLCPGYDAYLWHDASLALTVADSGRWCVDHLGDHDILVFRHPERHTIHEEAEFLRHKARHPYIRTRYAGEDLDHQLASIERDTLYVDDRLFAAGAFCYRPTAAIRHAFTDWWHHVTRYHVNDQLAFPYVLRACDVAVLDEDIYHASHLTWTRGTGHE